MEKMLKSASEKKYLIKNVSSVTICRLLGVASGIVTDAIILKTYGVGFETDALFTALAIPLVITRILEIQGPNVLIPVFSSEASELDKKTFQYSAGNTISIVAIVLFLISLTGTLFSDTLIAIQVPGFNDPTRHLAANLNKLLFSLIFIQGVETVMRCLLLSHHLFFVASLGKIIINLSILTAVLTLQQKLNIFAVAVGYVIGSIISLFIVNLNAYLNDIRIKVNINIKDKKILKTLKLFAFPLSGHTLGESKDLIENYIMSLLPRGDLSILRYGTRIITAVSSVLLGGIATTTLPLIAHYAAQNDRLRMKESFIRSFKIITLVAIPICIWLIFTSKNMLTLLYVRGQFTEKDAAAAGIVIALMTPYVLFSRLTSISQTPFFSLMEMKMPLYSMFVSFLSYIVVVASLYKILGIYCFPVAHSLSTIITTTFILSAFCRKFGSIFTNELWIFSVKLLITSMVTIGFFFVSTQIIQYISVNELADKILRFTIPSFFGMLSFFVASFMLKIGEWNVIINILRKPKDSKDSDYKKLIIRKETVQ
jgi:putative peptidoglycan lipid II flippase